MSAPQGDRNVARDDLGAARSDGPGIAQGRVAAATAAPVWGRTAFWCFLGCVLLTYVGVASNVIPGAGWAVCLLVAMGVGVTLAVISLVKRERRGYAVATLILAGTLPAAVIVGFVVFFSFFYLG